MIEKKNSVVIIKNVITTLFFWIKGSVFSKKSTCCICEGAKQVMLMKKQHITSINEEIIHIADKYIKKVIINTRNAYFKNKSQLNKQGIIF